MMIRKYLLTLLACFFISFTYAQYVPDILGDDYLCRTIQMPDDYEGKVVCSLIKKPQSPDTKQAILYIHGYNDYFFQKQLGDSVQAHGYNFYALDLRKYGRSILPNQDPFFCKSLKEYFADIDTALAIVREEGNEKILLMAHSTGGLITPYYMHHKQEKAKVDGLILNSPFFDWNLSWFMEKIVMPVVSFIGKIFPNIVVQDGGISSYAQSLLKQFKGEWEYDTRWKTLYGHPKKAGWIHAIHEAQQTIQEKADLKCPVLVLSSDQSFPETYEWDDAYFSSDIVLDVEDIQKYGQTLGDYVTRDTIPNGIHDLILSRKEARNHTYSTIFDWLKRYSF